MPVNEAILDPALWCEDTMHNTAEGEGRAHHKNVAEAGMTGTQ